MKRTFYTAIYILFGISCTTSEPTFRVMTHNVKGTQDAFSVANTVVEHDVDVLLLQEVHVSSTNDWLIRLSGLLGWNYYYGQLQIWNGEDFGQTAGTWSGGVAILAPQITNPRTIKYTATDPVRDYWDSLRGMVVAETPAGRVATTHWPVDGSTHNQHYADARNHLGQGSWVLGGDFNAPPYDGSHDAGPTYPNHDPTRTIDWFLSDGIAVVGVENVVSPVSDHRMVILEYR